MKQKMADQDYYNKECLRPWVLHSLAEWHAALKSTDQAACGHPSSSDFRASISFTVYSKEKTIGANMLEAVGFWKPLRPLKVVAGLHIRLSGQTPSQAATLMKINSCSGKEGYAVLAPAVLAVSQSGECFLTNSVPARLFVQATIVLQLTTVAAITS
jgi:hypothetical protein